MTVPTFKQLREEREAGLRGIRFQGRFLHPNPAFYKYYFYLFSEEANTEGSAFFSVENRLCIHTYRQRADAFPSESDLAFAYNERLPRRGPETPFDEDHPRWEGQEWAPPLAEDPDPVVKSGYR
jgi:hypothetical protein